MRDHPGHNVSILGGLWGIKLQNEAIRREYTKAFNQLLDDPLVNTTRLEYGADQDVLLKYFW